MCILDKARCVKISSEVQKTPSHKSCTCRDAIKLSESLYWMHMTVSFHDDPSKFLRGEVATVIV